MLNYQPPTFPLDPGKANEIFRNATQMQHKKK